MSRYLFTNNSLLSEISIQRSEGGGIRAYIYARDDAKPGQLGEVKKTLQENDFQWTPIFVAGRHALEVRGLGRDETKLLSLLHGKEYVVGSYEKKANIGDVMSLGDKLKKNTLRASGLAYIAGDIGFFSYEWKKSFKNGKLTDPQGILAGIFYAMGTPVITIFGKGDKSDFQLKDISYNMMESLKKDGIKVPNDSAMIAAIDGHNDGRFKKITNFLERYPAEVTNSLFGLAGTMLIWSGLKDYAHKKKVPTSAKSKGAIFMDIGLGAMTVLAGLISVFVEEEPLEKGEKRKTGLAGAWQWIKEKPLRAAGGALMVSTVSHTGATVKDWRNANAIIKSNPATEQLLEAKKLRSAVPGRAVFAGTNLTAEILMSLSSKGHGAGVKTDGSLDRSVYAVMADFVSRNPKGNRDILLAKISEFLSDKRHLGGPAADIENGIREQLKELEQNPWANLKTKAVKNYTAQNVKTDWREKAMAQAAPTTTIAAAIG